jgi:hypothetical protein
VLCPLEQLLNCLGIKERELFSDPLYTTPLPGTGTTIGEILSQLISGIQSHSAIPPQSLSLNNTLVQFLRLLDPYDQESLQRGVRVYSSSYRYYEYNSSMTRIPLVDSVLPTGGAISQLAWRLSKMKHEGIFNVSSRCQVSRCTL